MKKQNKKGFTLAELLIVVAIIAVLTAIAVPLFVGALNNAEERVKEANIRAVRGLAVSEIIGKPSTYRTTKYEKDGKHAYIATAKVDKNGNVSELTIWTTATTATAEKLGVKTVPSEAADQCDKQSDGSYNVAVYLVEIDDFTIGDESTGGGD